MDFYASLSGFLLGDIMTASIIVSVILFLGLIYVGAPFAVISIVTLAIVVGFGAPFWLAATILGLAVLLNVKPLRQIILSTPLLKIMAGLMPKISDTERTALEAGVVWREADLFSGRPNVDKLMEEPYPQLTEEEQAYMDGPVNEICNSCTDWENWKNRGLTDETMNLIKKHKLFGLIIPPEYGGLGFSNLFNSEVVQTLSSRSLPLAVTVMVPNSLGPAELLIHYGTDEQKKKYLPRLATGEEIPCFGLTEPQAGSDAGSISSSGDIFKGDDGELYIRLNWKKRWITLAAISTIIGLAFRLRDPDNLLGKGEDLGITCALIPSKTEGVVVGNRHDPLGVPFYNCPTEGHDVVVKAKDAIIGGLDGAGRGWHMLMESLAAGRGISLPAQSVGICKMATRAVSAHSLVRKQFGVSIGKFEGVEEPLARIAGKTYLLEALRRYTISPLEQGIKPPVVTAMTKYSATEIGRTVGNDAMDILGGAGISMGPRNLLAIPHIAAPIGITVEGANILTRTLIVFGQGALRCHPYAFKEVDAIADGNVKAFDEAFFGHLGHVGRNKTRMFLLGLTRGLIAPRGYGKGTGRYFQKLVWASASFAFMADVAMGLLGGKLKFKEKITGRFADIFSWLYIGTSVLRRYQAEGYQKEDLPLVHYSMQLAFYNIQKAFEGIYANFDVPLIGWVFKGPMLWFSSFNSFGSEPSDKLGHEVCSLVLKDTKSRDRITEGAYLPLDNPEEQLGRLEAAFLSTLKAEAAERKIRKAVRKKILPKKRVKFLVDDAVAKNVITAEEAEEIKRSQALRLDAIQVDDFTEEEFRANKWPPDHSKGSTQKEPPAGASVTPLRETSS